MNPLHQLLDRLRNDAAIIQFFEDNYSLMAQHFIGYKSAPNARDFPFIAYVATRTVRTRLKIKRMDVSVIIGVNEPGIVNGVFDGVRLLDQAEQKIIEALFPLRLDADWSIDPGDIEVVNDLSWQHPFHQREIRLAIAGRGILRRD